jgi:hypothetical protein
MNDDFTTRTAADTIEATPNVAWLKSADATDDPAGDLIADMRCDLASDPAAAFPRLFPNLEAMRAKGACQEAARRRSYPSAWIPKTAGTSLVLRVANINDRRQTRRKRGKRKQSPPRPRRTRDKAPFGFATPPCPAVLPQLVSSSRVASVLERFVRATASERRSATGPKMTVRAPQ